MEEPLESSEPLKFEQALARLEEVVRQLESGEPGLEDALKLFEEGVALSRQCTNMLDEADAKIEMLIQGENDDVSGAAPGRTRRVSVPQGDEAAHSS